METYQLDGAMGSRLVPLLLAVEQKTLASLAGPRSNVVGGVGNLLVLQVVGESLGVDSLVAEPEELLGVDEVPGNRIVSSMFLVRWKCN